MTLPLKPQRGGFLRPFGCGQFVRDYLSGSGPYGSPAIDPAMGSPQADIFFHYKNSLRQATAEDRAVREEERLAKKQRRAIDPANIDRLTGKHLERLPYKATGCRAHSFVVYFSNLIRLGWVEFTGVEEPSSFQDNYPKGQPRRYYRLTPKGLAASDAAWRNPLRTLYG